jgi:hypothetical protein
MTTQTASPIPTTCAQPGDYARARASSIDQCGDELLADILDAQSQGVPLELYFEARRADLDHTEVTIAYSRLGRQDYRLGNFIAARRSGLTAAEFDKSQC